MAILDRLFNRQNKELGSITTAQFTDIHQVLDLRSVNYQDSIVELYKVLPELSWAVNYLISLSKNIRPVIKRWSDDKILWETDTLYGEEKVVVEKVSKLLNNPNYIDRTWSNFLECYLLEKILTGNAFLMAKGVNDDSLTKYRQINSLFPLKTSKVTTKVDNNINIYTANSFNDIIKYYTLYSPNGQMIKIEPFQMLHIKEGKSDINSLQGVSRLVNLKKVFEILLQVYEARYTIYANRGVLGIIASEKHDESVALPLNAKEKQELQDTFKSTYGLNRKKDQFIISSIPLKYIDVAPQIQNLQPFEETLQDAVQIAAALGIPSELVPRKDHSTFDNQLQAQISVYRDTVLPEMKLLFDNLTEYLGLREVGYYIGMDLSNIDVLNEIEDKEI